MSNHVYDAVCVGAHPDDVEIGMGGTIAKMVAAGAKVAIVDLTNGEPTPFGTPATRAVESAAAARSLGVERRTLSQPNRYLMDTVEARIELAEVLREFRPASLFIPYAIDAHPDHIAASQICVAARFYSKFTKTDMAHEPFFPARVYRYMAVHQRLVAEPSYLVDVTGFLDAKARAIECYESQFAHNPANSDVVGFVTQMARHWGAIGRVDAAEPFFSLEPVTIANPLDLI